jgi:hypothetical protein
MITGWKGNPYVNRGGIEKKARAGERADLPKAPSDRFPEAHGMH